MTAWLLFAALALPAAAQHPTPPSRPAAETKAEAKATAKTEPRARTSSEPVDAAARILERLDREFPYKTAGIGSDSGAKQTAHPKPLGSKPEETSKASEASKPTTHGTPKSGVPETRRPSRLTLSWRITLTWPAMQ